jgi:glycosyltransferase involved in cell wall biosynthesis
MNILLINDFFEGGGAETVFRDQAGILKKDSRLEIFYAFKYIPDRKFTPFSYIYSFHFKRKLTVFLQKRHFDAIIVHNYCSALSPAILDVLYSYKKENKCKVIYYAHDYHLVCPDRGYSYFCKGKTINFQNPPNLPSIIFKRMDQRGFIHSILKKIQWIGAYPIGKKQKVFDLILAPSDFLVSQIHLSYPDFEVKRIYNPCNALDFKVIEKGGEKSAILRMVYFGRLVPEKGLAGFVEGLAASDVNYSFTMIGEGEEEIIIRNKIKQFRLENKIFIKPKLKQHELFAELQKYDVFVLASLCYENAPLTVVEAASVDLGLFLANHGGVLEMGKICNASHFFEPEDPKDIASKLKDLYKDFSDGSLPKADKKRLQSLFSKETYTENLKNLLLSIQ